MGKADQVDAAAGVELVDDDAFDAEPDEPESLDAADFSPDVPELEEPSVFLPESRLSVR